MDQSCQEAALSNAHSRDTVQLKAATSRWDMGSKRLSCRALHRQDTLLSLHEWRVAKAS